jgi:putative DNA primase/helicase
MLANPRERTKPGKVAQLHPEYEHMTDTGNARRMIALHGEEIVYCETFKSWFIWNGKIWERDTKLAIMEIAKATVRRMLKEAPDCPGGDKEYKARVRWCLSCESTAKLKAMIENAKSAMAVGPDELDSDPYLLTVENGTIDLRSGELRPHDPGDYITLMAPTRFDPDATDPMWEEVLDRFVRPDDGKEEFLRRAAFAALTGSSTDKAFINLFDDNDGNTGKTTFLGSLLAVVGPYGITVPAETFLAKSGGGGIRADLGACARKRMVASSETPAGRKLDTALMKRLTDGDGRYQFERKYENPWEAEITFTIFIDGNTVAKANAEDNPLFNRWRLVPFKHKLKRKPDDKWLANAKASPKYRAAVLAWAMAGREAWWSDGIGNAPVVEKATAEVRRAMDPLQPFWEARVEFGPHNPHRRGRDIPPAERYLVTTTQLWAAYTDWARSAEHKPINEPAFFALLKGKGAEPTTIKLDGDVVKGWKNARLKPVQKSIKTKRYG